MNQLQVEVLLNVFSFVPKDELMTTIPQVCRRWKDAAADPSLFRTLDLVTDDPDTETAIRVLSTASWLTSLNLSGRTDTDVLIQHIGVNHPRLVKLVIHECQGTRSKVEVSAMQLRYLVRRCTQLQQFSLLKTDCNSTVLGTEIGVNLRDLRVFENCHSLQFDSKALISITNNCNRIEKLHVEYWDKEPFSGNVLANFCNKFKESLTSLALDDTAWTNVSLTSLSRCRNVKELAFHDFSANITDDGIMKLCQMQKLESLDIFARGNITSMGWARFFENASMKSLVKLTLYGYTNDVVVTAVSRLPNLTDLDITRGNVTDEGLLSMSNIPNLAHLRIFVDSNVTTGGWIRFFQTINVRQKMTHLRLLFCENLNFEVAKVIVQNLQKLQQLELVQ